MRLDPLSFAALAMSGPRIKKRGGVRKKELKICAKCAVAYPLEHFIDYPFHVCQVCRAKSAVEKMRSQKRAA